MTGIEIQRISLNKHDPGLCNGVKRYVEFQYMRGSSLALSVCYARM